MVRNYLTAAVLAGLMLGALVSGCGSSEDGAAATASRQDACEVLTKTSCKKGFQDVEACESHLEKLFADDADCKEEENAYLACVANSSDTPKCWDIGMSEDHNYPEVESCRDAKLRYFECSACITSSDESDCSRCVKSKCCEQLRNQARHRDELLLWTNCVLDCQGNAACETSCGSRYPNGRSVSEATRQCKSVACQAECGL